MPHCVQFRQGILYLYVRIYDIQQTFISCDALNHRWFDRVRRMNMAWTSRLQAFALNDRDVRYNINMIMVRATAGEPCYWYLASQVCAVGLNMYSDVFIE